MRYIFLLIILFSCDVKSSRKYYKLTSVDTINDYFFEITTKNEYYPNRHTNPMKWKKRNVSIAMLGKPSAEDIKIFTEVAQYVEGVLNIRFTYINKEESDILFYIGSHDFLESELLSYFPQTKLSRVSLTALANFETKFFDRTSIKKSYVFVSEGVIPKYKKHLFLEELIQSMGFPNDSYKYPNSIFYQGESCDTVFSKMDSAIIKILYP